MKSISQNQTVEWSFTSSKARIAASDEVECSACFQRADGNKQVIPAFTAPEGKSKDYQPRRRRDADVAG